MAAATAGRMVRQSQILTALKAIGRATTSSITRKAAAAMRGSITALATGMKIIAPPKPANPRTAPPTAAARQTRSTVGSEKDGRRSSSMSGAGRIGERSDGY